MIKLPVADLKDIDDSDSSIEVDKLDNVNEIIINERASNYNDDLKDLADKASEDLHSFFSALQCARQCT